MQITAIKRSETLLQILAVIGRKKFEFTSFRNGTMEVYDFPRSWNGTPRFVGTLPSETEEHLRVMARAQDVRAYNGWAI
jgi:hypothetical protein